MIWGGIQRVKQKKNDIHTVGLDLANANGSVPHKVSQFALEFFHVPEPINNLVTNYFRNFKMCFSQDGSSW